MKKLLLTLMCIVAAAIPAFADVTYEPVALSDINSGDEVVMVGSNGGKLYFATPTIDSSSYLTCLAVTGDVSERVTLTDDQNGQIQKFIITTDGSTVSLKKNDADEYLAFEGTNGGLSWGAETQFTTTNSTKEGGGIYLVGSKPAIGFFPGTFNIFFAGGAVANSCNGIHFFKEVTVVEEPGTKFTAGATSAFYVTEMGENKPALFGVVENGTSTKYTLTPGTYYIYPAENRQITSFTVDGTNGQIWFNEFGSFTVKAGQEPKEIIVNTTEPIVVDKRTKFVVSGGGTVEIWYQNSSYEFVKLTTLEPDADGIAYAELPDKINELDIVAGAKSRLTEVYDGTNRITTFINGEYSGMPGDYCYFLANAIQQEYHVTCVPATKVTFNISTADSAILKDSEGNVVFTLGRYASETKMLNTGSTYYIYNSPDYELKSVTSSTGESLTIEKISDSEQRAAFTVGNDAVTYTIECPAPPKEPAKLIFPNGRNVSIYTYYAPKTLVVNFEEDEDVNTFDFDAAAAAYYLIVAHKGYKLTSVEVDPAVSVTETRINSTNQTMANGNVFNSWCYLYKKWDPKSVTITIEKVINVDFEVTEGSKAVLMHDDGSKWVTDYTFNALKAAQNANVSLAQGTDYYLFAINGYALKEVLGDNGEAMTIAECEEHMPYSSNYVMFNSNDAPSKITIDSPEKKVEVDPSTVEENQVAGFDFTDPRFIFNVETGEPITTGTYFTDRTVLTDLAGTVQIELLDRQMQFTAGYTSGGVVYPSYLSVPPLTSTQWFTNPAGRLKFKFNDNVSTFTKIEFTVGSGYFTASNGNLLGTVWEPSAPASAPSTYTVNAASGTNEVIFTAAQQVDLQKVRVTFTGPKVPTRIETVEASAEDVEAVYYNLQGVRVENPAAGIYVRVRGNQVDKVLVK